MRLGPPTLLSSHADLVSSDFSTRKHTSMRYMHGTIKVVNYNSNILLIAPPEAVSPPKGSTRVPPPFPGIIPFYVVIGMHYWCSLMW